MKHRLNPSDNPLSTYCSGMLPLTLKGVLEAPSVPGRIYVSYGGSPPIPAENYSMLEDTELLKPENRGLEVLLLFEEGDPSKPVIVSARGSLFQKILKKTVSKELKAIPQMVHINGHRIELEAAADLILRCGKSLISITNKGVIRFEGTDIEMMSHGENRIKGSTIELN